MSVQTIYLTLLSQSQQYLKPWLPIKLPASSVHFALGISNCTNDICPSWLPCETSSFHFPTGRKSNLSFKALDSDTQLGNIADEGVSCSLTMYFLPLVTELGILLAEMFHNWSSLESITDWWNHWFSYLLWQAWWRSSKDRSIHSADLSQETWLIYIDVYFPFLFIHFLLCSLLYSSLNFSIVLTSWAEWKYRIGKILKISIDLLSLCLLIQARKILLRLITLVAVN